MARPTRTPARRYLRHTSDGFTFLYNGRILFVADRFSLGKAVRRIRGRPNRFQGIALEVSMEVVHDGEPFTVRTIIRAEEGTAIFRAGPIFLHPEERVRSETMAGEAEFEVVGRGVCTLAGVVGDDIAWEAVQEENRRRLEAAREELRRAAA